MPATMSGPSLQALGDLIRNGQAEAPPMPPEMSVDEVEAALNGNQKVKLSKPARQDFPGLLPKFIRSRGPTIDRLTGAAVEQDLPPTYGSSYKDKMRSLMADGNVAGDSNVSPVRVDSNVEFKKPGDPRGSDTGTIVFNQDVPGRGGSIFDNQRGRDYLTAATLRQEAMDRGETNLPQLPGLRGQGMGTPAGQPIPGGKTDQYNQMKAAQRANQLANEANAPNLIMAREQMRNYGPRGAVMMKLLAQGGSGQGGGMDPALLAGLDPNMADAALRQQDISGLNKRREGETAIGMRNAGTNEFVAQTNAEHQKRVADIQELATKGKITNDEALARIAQADVDAKIKISADRNQTLRDTTNSTNDTQFSIATGAQDVQRQLGMARIAVDRLVANNQVDINTANNLIELKRLEQTAKLAGKELEFKKYQADIQKEMQGLDINTRAQLGKLGFEADRYKTDTNARTNIVTQDESLSAPEMMNLAGLDRGSAIPVSPASVAKRALQSLPPNASPVDAIKSLLLDPNVASDPQARAAIVNHFGSQKLKDALYEIDPTQWGILGKIGNEIGFSKQKTMPENMGLSDKVVYGAQKLITGKPNSKIESAEETAARQRTIAEIKRLLLGQ